MEKLSIIINEKGIERVSITACSPGEEKRFLSLYEVIGEDLRALDKKIQKTLLPDLQNKCSEQKVKGTTV